MRSLCGTPPHLSTMYAGAMPRRLPVYMILLLCSGTGRADEKTAPWEPVRDEDGIAVVSRTVATSPLREFRGNGRVEAPLAAVLAVIRDCPHRPEWMYQALESHVVEESDRRQVSYTLNSAPWPATDRDIVVQSDISVDSALHILFVDFHEVTDPRAPPQKGAVRMPLVRGHWALHPVDHGRATMVEYQVHADPGGSVPSWVINRVSKKLPWETIQGLRRQTARRRYPEYEARFAAVPGFQALVADSK
jgi:hypothetical protein